MTLVSNGHSDVLNAFSIWNPLKQQSVEPLSVNVYVCAAGGRSGIHVEFSSLSFYFRSCGDLSDEEMDRVCQFLHNRVQNQERTQLYQLTACFTAFRRWEQHVRKALPLVRVAETKAIHRRRVTSTWQRRISQRLVLRWRLGWESQPPPEAPPLRVLRQAAGPEPRLCAAGSGGACQTQGRTGRHLDRRGRRVSLFWWRVVAFRCSCPTGRSRSGPTSGASSPRGATRNSLEEPSRESCTA